MTVQVPQWFVLMLTAVVLVRTGSWLVGFFKNYSKFRSHERLIIWVLASSPWLVLLTYLWGHELSTDLIFAYIVGIHAVKIIKT